MTIVDIVIYRNIIIQMWRVAANVLNKQLWTANTRFPPKLGWASF